MSVNPQSAAAFARLAAGIVVLVAAWLGIDVDADLAENVIIVLFAIGVLIYLWWWKNQPVTKAAQEAQEYFLMAKEEQAEKKEQDRELAAEAAEKETESNED